jgi:(1->4)-alpha-D-glucan 1-alpha-D-glucosylmutase
LLEQQAYRLAFWRVAADEINYRRFFDINELAGIRMENPEVFAHTHRLVGQLITDGRLHGLRLDHIDGLLDPGGYLGQLRRFAAERAPSFYITVEKILARHERLRSDWPVDGTTGRPHQPGQRPLRRSDESRRWIAPSPFPRPP